ncbi:hypothetical protein ACFL3V_01065 [Nanoarchaeota archaeon]
MAGSLVVQVISIVIVAGLFLLMVLWKKAHYVIGGLTLCAISTLTVLFKIGKTTFDVGQYPILHYAVYFFVAFAGKDLIKEGFKEKESALKWPSLILGVVLIVITTIPTLKKMHVIEWALPKSVYVDASIYAIAGLFMIIGAFTILATKE